MSARPVASNVILIVVVKTVGRRNDRKCETIQVLQARSIEVQGFSLCPQKLIAWGPGTNAEFSPLTVVDYRNHTGALVITYTILVSRQNNYSTKKPPETLTMGTLVTSLWNALRILWLGGEALDAEGLLVIHASC